MKFIYCDKWNLLHSGTYDNLFTNFEIQFAYTIPIKPTKPTKPKTLKIYRDLFDTNLLKKDLNNLGGVYGLIHIKSSKQYIGSSSNLYSRIMDHIKGRKSNPRLQRSIQKNHLENFNLRIYYYHTDPTVSLRNIETSVISAFPSYSLFNIRKKG